MHQFLYGHGQAETARKITVASTYPANALSPALSKLAKVELSYRDVEDILAERGIDVSYETVRRWALKFGTIIARRLRRGRPRPDGRWHLDEVFVSVNGKQLYVWRAVDSEGELLDILVQPRRDRQAAFKLMRKLLKKQGITPATIVTDKLRSYVLRCANLVLRGVTTPVAGRITGQRIPISHCDNANDV